MGNVTPNGERVAVAPGEISAADSSSSDGDVPRQEIIDFSRPQPTTIVRHEDGDRAPTLTGEKAITGAQLRGQNVIVSQPTGMSFAADNQPNVRSGGFGLDIDPATESSHSQYHSFDQSELEEQDRFQSTPYQRHPKELQRRRSLASATSVRSQISPIVSLVDTDEEFVQQIRRRVPLTTPLTERVEFSLRSDLANNLPTRLASRHREMSAQELETTSFHTATSQLDSSGQPDLVLSQQTMMVVNVGQQRDLQRRKLRPWMKKHNSKEECKTTQLRRKSLNI